MQIYADIKSCFHRRRVSTAESSTHCSHTWKLVSFSTGAPAWLTDRELPSKEGSPLMASSSSTQDRLQRVRRRETRSRVGSADPTRDSTNFQFPFHCAGVLVCGAAGRCGFIPSRTHTVIVLLRVWGSQAVSCSLQQLFMVLFARSAKGEKPGGFKRGSERLRENFVESFCCCLLFLSIVENELESWREEICSRDYYSKLKGVMITKSRDAIRSGYRTCEKVNKRKSSG